MVKMSSYTKIAFRGVVVVSSISLIAGFLGYIARVLLARNLTVEEFGLFYAVFAFLGLIGTYRSLGFDKALARFIPEFLHKKKDDHIKSSIIYVIFIQLVTNTIIIIAVYLLSDFLAASFFKNSQAGIVLRWLAIAFFVDSFVMVLKFSFQGFRRMVYFSIIDLVRMLLIISILLIGFRLNYGLMSPVFAYVITPFILVLIFGTILVKKTFPKFLKSNFLLDGALIRKISKYSIFVLSISVEGIVLHYTDVMTLTYLTDLKVVALYNIALPTINVLLFFPRAIGGILSPLTTELWVKKKGMLLAEGIKSLYKYSLIIIIPVVFMMFSFSELLINVLYGKEYVAASNTMKILVIGMIFAILYGINSRFFAGIGKPQITTKIVSIATVFNLVANIALIPIIGIRGAALATSLSYFIMMGLSLLEIRKLIEISFPIKVWLKTLIAGIMFTAIIFLLKSILSLNVWIETFIVLLMSGIAYILLLFVLRVMTIEEIKDLYRRIVK